MGTAGSGEGNLRGKAVGGEWGNDDLQDIENKDVNRNSDGED